MNYIKDYKGYLNINSYRMDESASNIVISNAITNVISDQKKSKDYGDLFVDSNGYTAVGILHFTKSGLKNLYKTMDTVKFFNKSNEEMIKSIKSYKGKEIEDINWKKGIEKFLNSKENIQVQNEAALSKFKPYFSKYASSWSTERQYAIGVSIINSSPKNFVDFGNEYGWDAEKMMYAYCKFESDKHVKRGKKEGRCRTRCRKINGYYPYNGDTNNYYFKGCSDLKLENPFDHDTSAMQTQGTTAIGNTVESGLTDDQAVAYRTWANGKAELKDKYGKTSEFDLDATGINNNFIKRSYAQAKLDYDSGKGNDNMLKKFWASSGKANAWRSEFEKIVGIK